MKKEHLVIPAILCAVVINLILLTSKANAHCDTLAGPVIADAKSALASGEVTPVLKWVTSGEEDVVRAVFEQTLAVRTLGGDARDMADMYFFETLVRIHRAGEGAPYTGLRNEAAVDPAVLLADKAIAGGTADELITVLSGALERGLNERFKEVVETGKNKDVSVAAGRKYVAAYVEFTHFAEAIHAVLKGGAEHHGQ